MTRLVRLALVLFLLARAAPVRAQDAPATAASADAPEADPPPPEVAPPEPPARHADAPTAHAERYVLENGLRVVLDPNDEDTVGVCVTYHVGASAQPAGWTGLAHLTEHVMFEGTPHAPGHYLDQLDPLGPLEVNGTTERDRTRYYEVVPREHLARTLFLEADRMAFVASHVTDRAVELQQQVVLREREERVDLGGLGLVPGLIASVLYVAPGHPYGDLFEHREDIEALHRADIEWFIATHYAPDRATLAISGGFDPVEAHALVERWFGPIGRIAPAPPAPVAPTIAQLALERRLVVEAPVRHDDLRVIWPTPPYGHPVDSALDLVASWLQRRLRSELSGSARATSVDVAQASFEQASEFVIDVEVPRGDGTMFALEAIDRAIADLLARPLGPREVSELARDYASDTLLSLESTTLRVSRLAREIALAPNGQWSLDWDRDRHAAVTPEQFADAVRTWLPLHQRLVLSLAARRDAPWDGRVVVDLSLGPDGEPTTQAAQ
jgi:zinc protease